MCVRLVLTVPLCPEVGGNCWGFGWGRVSVEAQLLSAPITFAPFTMAAKKKSSLNKGKVPKYGPQHTEGVSAALSIAFQTHTMSNAGTEANAHAGHPSPCRHQQWRGMVLDVAEIDHVCVLAVSCASADADARVDACVVRVFSTSVIAVRKPHPRTRHTPSFCLLIWYKIYVFKRTRIRAYQTFEVVFSF